MQHRMHQHSVWPGPQRFAAGHGTAARRRPRCTPSTTATYSYTAIDLASAASVFRPPLVDVGPLLRTGQLPARKVIEQIRAECESTGFLALTGHGISESQLRTLFAAARLLFDLPLDEKRRLVVGDMLKGRGYEISPEHREYMELFGSSGGLTTTTTTSTSSSSSSKRRSKPAVAASIDTPAPPPPAAATTAASVIAAAEPSARDGILSERFLCGPPLSVEQRADPYYSNGLGPVFFAPDAWPSEAAAPGLRAAMEAAHLDLCRVADAALRLMAAALDLEDNYFQQLTKRACSNLQVANYPSQPVDPADLGPSHIRKKAHTDSGLVTLLASEDWLPGGAWRPGDGGLQLLTGDGRWVEVAVPEGALLLNLGSLLTRLTNGRWKSTLHRVTNPTRRHAADTPQQQQPVSPASQRRLSVALFHKPDYDALIDVVPTCLDATDDDISRQQPGSSTRMGASGSGGRRFPPALAADLTRAGVLARYAHLPPDEASRRYHEEMAAVHRAAAEAAAGGGEQ